MGPAGEVACVKLILAWEVSTCVCYYPILISSSRTLIKCDLSFPSSLVEIPFSFHCSFDPSLHLLLHQECVTSHLEGRQARRQGSMALGALNLLAKNRGAVLVAAVANTASLLFGYDTGVAFHNMQGGTAQ